MRGVNGRWHPVDRDLDITPAGPAPRPGHRGNAQTADWSDRSGVAWWEVAVAGVALIAAVVAVWVTLEADFLANPGWLAAQKADFILGPTFVGLYWLRQRPESRFGPLLIGFGLVGAVYTVQSSSNELLFGAGVLWEIAIYLWNLVLILTFPTGRLDGGRRS
jgi:hypothetical protein